MLHMRNLRLREVVLKVWPADHSIIWELMKMLILKPYPQPYKIKSSGGGPRKPF